MFEWGKDPLHLLPWGWWWFLQFPDCSILSPQIGSGSFVRHSARFLLAAPSLDSSAPLVYLSVLRPLQWFVVTWYKSWCLLEQVTPPGFSSGVAWLFPSLCSFVYILNHLVKFNFFFKDGSFCFTEERKEEWHFWNFIGKIKLLGKTALLQILFPMWPWNFHF